MSVPGGEVQRQIAGRYRVDGPLGSGAMGTVWSGFDDVLQRRVAIKELKIPDGMPSGEEIELRERMMREARALAGLSHPNVVTVFDVLDSGGEPLVVMELVPSRNLASAIGELGRLDRAQAAVVGFGTAAALRAAHRAGITHRDVKPGNVLISDDGRIKLTDFGIARNESDAPMTSAGLVLGSPAYIAPEVAAGQPVTPAADLWGLGATLFAAVEGRPPYDVNGDPVQTITEVVDGDVPRLSEPGPVSDVIAGLMVKEPDDRMPLDEVRARLRPLLADPDDPIFPGSPDVPTLMARVPSSTGRPSTGGAGAGESGTGGSGTSAAYPVSAFEPGGAAAPAAPPS
ncbi:MAG: serine/threonine protein kinase, partial [Pseudonocardia sp.]|nr:serine/threonine protein kinase [Pseudonocardia sp.]